jgi:hypothetical protein
LKEQKTSILGCGVLLVVLIGITVVAYDLLFSKPELLEGVILEKTFIPGTPQTSGTPYAGARRGNFFVTVHKDDQWIALIKTKNGEQLQVHCLLEHYESKNVGDSIQFKRYEGHLTHIEYFAHNEEY